MLFSPFLVSQAQKRETSPGTTGTTSEDERSKKMKKEDLVAKGLSEEHAQIAVDAWNEAVKGFVPKDRFDEVSGKLKEANSTICLLYTSFCRHRRFSTRHGISRA